MDIMNRSTERQQELFKSVFLKHRSRLPRLPKLSKMDNRLEHSSYFEEKFLPEIKTKIKISASLKSEKIFNHDQDSLYWLNSFELFSNESFSENKKFLIHSKNLSKLKALITKENEKLKNFNSIESNSAIDEVKMVNFKFKFKKIVKIVLILLKFINIYKITKENQQNLYELDRDFKDGALFDKKYFKRPEEPPLSEEVKKMLKLDPAQRSNSIIRHIIISLSFSVPEFLDFPLFMQKLIAKYAFYAEYAPNRVIIRQGHLPQNFYFVISGLAMEIRSSLTFTSETPVGVFKRGDSFGDKSIINNTPRSSSVSVSGTRPICLLEIDKEDFFKIQSPVSSEVERTDFLHKVDLFNLVKYNFQSLLKDNRNNQALCSIYFKNGQIICENSQLDDWIYVVKSGTCKVLRRIKFDKEAFEKYLNLNKHKENFQFIHLHDFKSKVKTGQRKNVNTGKNLNSDEVLLKMKQLKEGDIFGLHDVILCEKDDQKIPLMLHSDGVECIMISRQYFLKYLQSQALLTLRFNLHPYPSDEYLIGKYFDSVRWNDFLQKSKNETIRFLKEYKLVKR